MKVYMVNVGVNKSHEAYGLMSPIFPDRKFEFIPIEEGWPTKLTKRYHDLKSFYSKNDLTNFIPLEYWDEYVHLDPNFEYNLYGDVPTVRGRNLYGVEVGDIVLFLARLVSYDDNRFDRSRGSLYLIGEMKVEKKWIFPNKLRKKDFSDLKHHAHIIREIGDNPKKSYISDEFVAIKGTNNSGRYYLAVPITKTVCNRFLRDKENKKFNWFGPPNQVIGSYTRTARAFFDLDDPKQKKRWLGFKEYIHDKCK